MTTLTAFLMMTQRKYLWTIEGKKDFDLTLNIIFLVLRLRNRKAIADVNKIFVSKIDRTRNRRTFFFLFHFIKSRGIINNSID